MNKKIYFKMVLYVLFIVFVLGGQVTAEEEEEEAQSRPNPIEKVAGPEAGSEGQAQGESMTIPGDTGGNDRQSSQQPQGWIIKEVNEINTGNGPGGERPAAPDQQMRPAAPAQKIRPAAPHQQMRPASPAQKMRPAAPRR